MRNGSHKIKVMTPKEMTNYEAFQLEKYGNALPTIEATPEGELYESGLAELERLAEYINVQTGREVHKHE